MGKGILLLSEFFFKRSHNLVVALIGLAFLAMLSVPTDAYAARRRTQSAISPSGTSIPSATRMVDAQHDIWTVSGGVIYENGSKAGYSSGVTLLLYYDGRVYQENSQGKFWVWSNSTWVAVSGDPRVPAPLPTPAHKPTPAPAPAPKYYPGSANGTTVPPYSQITDTVGNVWTVNPTITSTQLTPVAVFENGTQVGTGVDLLLYYNGVVYQLDNNGLYYGWINNTWVAQSANPRYASNTPSVAAADQGTLPAPAQAAAVGYTINTFSTISFTTANVDMGNTVNAGYQWYLHNPYGWADTPASTVVLNSDGSVTLTGSLNMAEGIAPNWHGFGFGGGAYIEGTLSFDPNQAIALNPSSGWPAFWATTLEHGELGWGSDLWPGQGPNYQHTIELDFFEYAAWLSMAGTGVDFTQWYQSTVIDWSGNYSQGFSMIQNAPGGGSNFGNHNVHVPDGTDFKQPHKYGALWVPATPTTRGYVQYYFDGQPVNDSVSWSYYDCANQPSPPPGTAPWTFGIVDCLHPRVILDSSPGMPMRVYNVNVWQSSTAKNLSN